MQIALGDADYEGTVYNLNKTYSINPKTNLRYWEKQVLVKHFGRNSYIYQGTPIKSDGENVVYFA